MSSRYRGLPRTWDVLSTHVLIIKKKRWQDQGFWVETEPRRLAWKWTVCVSVVQTHCPRSGVDDDGWPSRQLIKRVGAVCSLLWLLLSCSSLDDPLTNATTMWLTQVRTWVRTLSRAFQVLASIKKIPFPFSFTEIRKDDRTILLHFWLASPKVWALTSQGLSHVRAVTQTAVPLQN